ncbi:DNA polymerase ligase-domain-containing protein [Aspergillus unguis]
MHDGLTRRIASLEKEISPPPQASAPKPRLPQPPPDSIPVSGSSLSALEAGEESSSDHLIRISAHLHTFIPSPASSTLGIKTIPFEIWKDLYVRNSNTAGNHFVIHQHDHPIAGPHYDLRLQFSASSSVSWSVMYGLPGDANSRRLNRNATETRVHCLWNHLIETASDKTGSMILWDTGAYEVLPDKPRGEKEDAPETDSDSDLSLDHGVSDGLLQSEKLTNAFQNSKIHLRLHGTRLPKNYTIFLRRDKSDFRAAPTPESLAQMPRKKRRRTQRPRQPSTSSSEDIASSDTKTLAALGKRKPDAEPEDEHSDAEGGNVDTDLQIRLNNAYPGAVNDIGSIHQRRWFIVLDRPGSGFVRQRDPDDKGKGRWVRGRDKRTGELTGFEPFYVRGPEAERSVLTGRLGSEVLRDEGVKAFIPRKGWRPVFL